MHIKYNLNKFLLSGCLILLSICTLSVDAQGQDTRNTVFRFLNLPTSARTAALGGMHVSLNDADISLFQQNPAYLDSAHHRQFALSYTNLLSDVNMGSFGGAYQIRSYGTAALGVRYVNYGQIDKRDEQGNLMGTFQANDLALTLGFGRSYSKSFQYGGSVDFIYSGFDVYQATGVGFNGGFLYKNSDLDLTLGASINHLGYQTGTFNGRREQLPFNISVAATKKLKHMPLRISLMGTKLNQWPRNIAAEDESPDTMEDIMRHLVIGGEFIISRHVHFRVGYDYYKHQQLETGKRLDMAGFSYGVGIDIKNFQFDFSRNSYSDIGALTQLSVQTSL